MTDTCDKRQHFSNAMKVFAVPALTLALCRALYDEAAMTLKPSFLMAEAWPVEGGTWGATMQAGANDDDVRQAHLL